MALFWDHPRVCGEHGQGCRSAPFAGDHPRVCGEHDPPVNGSDSLDHPAYVGTHDIPIPHIPRDGIIPAYAGNTHAVVPCHVVRIIPAYAGNTLPKVLAILTNWDHPRVCGGTLAYFRIEGRYWGSSPRMRGTLMQPSENDDMVGSSPRMRGTLAQSSRAASRRRDHPRACGNTLPAQMNSFCSWDHPRACGEH